MTLAAGNALVSPVSGAPAVTAARRDTGGSMSTAAVRVTARVTVTRTPATAFLGESQVLKPHPYAGGDRVTYGSGCILVCLTLSGAQGLTVVLTSAAHSSDASGAATGRMGHGGNKSEMALFRAEELFSALHHSGESQVV